MIVTKKNPDAIQDIRTPKGLGYLRWLGYQIYVKMRSFLGDQGVVKVPFAPLNGPSHSHTDTVGLRVPGIRVPRGKTLQTKFFTTGGRQKGESL